MEKLGSSEKRKGYSFLVSKEFFFFRKVVETAWLERKCKKRKSIHLIIL